MQKQPFHISIVDRLLKSDHNDFFALCKLIDLTEITNNHYEIVQTLRNSEHWGVHGIAEETAQGVIDQFKASINYGETYQLEGASDGPGVTLLSLSQAKNPYMIHLYYERTEGDEMYDYSHERTVAAQKEPYPSFLSDMKKDTSKYELYERAEPMNDLHWVIQSLIDKMFSKQPVQM